MNVLSLRINAVKSDESLRKINIDLIDFDIEDGIWKDEHKHQLEIIKKATTPEVQIKELKKFAQFISPASKEDSEKIASKLIQIYFKEKVKHPAKSTIQSCFNQSSEQEFLRNVISNEIRKHIDSLTCDNIDECFHFITCLNEATQNFRPAIAALGESVDSIIEFINKIILVFDSELKTELSPAQKNEISHQLHCSLQAVIFCLKTFFNETKEFSGGLKETLSEIVRKCVELLDNQDLPMDTKNNASMLIVLQSKLMKDSNFVDWIKDETSSVGKRLSLIFGVINTINVTSIDYQLLATISIILKKIYMISSVDPAAMLSVARSFMQVTKKLSTLQSIPSSRNLIHITETALSIAFLNLEHHVDSVRHLSRETLRYLAEIGNKLNDNQELLKSIFSEIKRLHTSNLAAIVVLSISPALKTSEILKKLPNFHKRLLKSVNDNKVTNHNLINCYEALAMKSLEESSFPAWFVDFVQPAVHEMKRHKLQTEELAILESLIVRFVKKEKKVLDEILKTRGDFDFGFVLLCLSTAKKTGRYDQVTSNSDLWKGLVKFDEIKNAMVHAEDSVRTSALMLIVESRKTTEKFNQQEIDCILFFLKYNINVQSPSMRQSILGLVKNLFVRIQSVLQSIIRKKEVEIVEFYFDFLMKLQEFCLENLFEGANFTRRTLSLRIMFYIVEAVQEFFKERSEEFWNQEKFDVLMEVLSDSFEANKEMTIEIMKLIPQEILKKFSKVTRIQLEKLVTSIKPPDSLTSSYLMEFVARFAFDFKEFNVKDVEIAEINQEDSGKSPEFYSMLIWCEKLILEGLETAEKSLIVASSTNPLYGIVLNIRHLLSKLDLKSLVGCQQWQDFLSRLIIICRRLTEVVAPVVNNSSPEGILPKEKMAGIPEDIREKWLEIAEQTTPQIILLCSWRTVKEVSLLLGDISLRAPIGLLSVDQILSIGDHFLELLSKTKHRGAFEQCFFGFSQLCLRLWQCNEPELHKLPSEMLQQMIESISGRGKERNELLTMKNLCATRRSAGLPFMIQALITSELKVSTNKNFHFVMQNLIDFCRTAEFLETRTHSLNILRALFRCSDLNEAIGEYIAAGMKCAILGYGAESWIERNSSTLLFSSLMVRIFGVQRTKDSDDLNIRNKMTGRIFFLRYPELYDFFMEQLQEAAEFVKNVKMNAKLHPLLLLLIRLYPSALEGSESNLKLTDFIPVVAMCSGCVEMQTRILCAKFIAGVSPPDTMIQRIQETTEILAENENLPANVAHGILLQILYEVKTLPAVQRDEFSENESNLLIILDEIAEIGQRFSNKLILFGTFLDIIWEIFAKLREVKMEHQKKLEEYLEMFLEFDAKAVFGVPLIAKKIYLLKGLLNTASFVGNLKDFVEKSSQNSEESLEKIEKNMEKLNFRNNDPVQTQNTDQKSVQSQETSQNPVQHQNTKQELVQNLKPRQQPVQNRNTNQEPVQNPKTSQELVQNQHASHEIFENSAIKHQIKELLLNTALLSLDFSFASSVQDDYGISDKEVFIFKQSCDLKQPKMNNHQKIQKPPKSTNQDLKSLCRQTIGTSDYNLAVKSFDLLSLIEYKTGDADLEKIQKMVEEAIAKPEHMKKSMLKYLNHVVIHEDFLLKLDFEFLVEISTDPSFFVKSTATEFVKSIAFNLFSIQSLDTILYFSKSLLLLLMDDEVEIREQNAKTVMQLLGEADREVIPIYAQELFIGFLMDKLCSVDVFAVIALVTLIVIDDAEGENSLDENISEYRVFEKNEVNIFSETFVVRRICSEKLKEKLLKIPGEIDENIPKVVEVSQKLKHTKSRLIVENFLRTVLKN